MDIDSLVGSCQPGNDFMIKSGLSIVMYDE